MVLLPYDRFVMTTEKSPQRFMNDLLRLTKGEEPEYKMSGERASDRSAALSAQLTAEGFNPVLSVSLREEDGKTRVSARLTFSKAAYIVMAVLFAALLSLIIIGAVILAKTGDASVMSVPVILTIFFYALACVLFALAKRKILSDLNEIV